MRYLLFLFTLFCLNSVHAQWSWPVQVNAFTNGPYYNYLSYYADQNDHLQILVALTDQNATSVPAKLHLRIEGAGWWVETNPNNNIPPLYLEPFVPNIISGILLQAYLQESNLIKSDPSLDLNNLPEGFTEVCVEVKGVGGTLTTIGGNQCTPFWLQRFQPPQAFVPQCGAQLDTNSMFHSFQWTIPPGYTPFVNVNSEMEYTFSLYEWVDQNNYSIFQTGQGLVYQNTVTNIEQIVINDFEVQWQQGMKYVWRIQAQLYNNGMPVTIFENNGLSEICTFTYGEAQTLEEELTEGLYIDLTAFANTQYKGSANWTVIDQVQGGLSQYSSYLVEYRLKPDSEHPNPIWHYDTVVSTAKALYQLAPENTYEVRVSGMAGTFTSDPTPIVEFTTPAAVDYTCGDVQIPFRPSTVIPNENVIAGDQVQIGKFQMTISQVVPQYEQGRYAGSGTIPVDFLGGARAKVTFDNILIDKDYIVHDGRVDVTTDGVDAWLNEQMQDFVDPIYVNGTVDSAWVDTTAGVAWVIVDGVSIEFVFDPPNYPIVIHDNSGLAWTIYPNGTITVSGYLDASNDTLDVTAANTVHFQQNSIETFGFDAKQHMEWHENYEIIELSDSTYYFVANKSIGKGETDVVDIAIPSGVTPTFKLDDQTTLSASPFGGGQGGGYTVSIPAIGSSGKTELYVYNDSDERIGKLNITVFNAKDRKVIVVPMANVSVDATQLETVLQNTLGEANLDFDVTVEAQWNNAAFTNSTTIALPEMTSLMTSYSQDMRDLRDAYFADPNVQKDNSAYYLFVIPDFDDPNADGYMVRGKGLGFIKAGSDYLTYAHELAHGMGALEHTWKWNGPAQGSTNNLMDYASTGSATPSTGSATPSTNAAENLTKEQWEDLRGAGLLSNLWDDVEDAGSYTVDLSEISSLSNPDGSFSFFRVNGNYITIPSNSRSISFSSLDRMFEHISNNETSLLAPIGSIIGFVDESNITYLTDGSGAFKAVNVYTGNTVGGGYYNDTLTENIEPSTAITSIFAPLENDSVTQFFFKVASPIGQTDFTAEGGSSLQNLILFENSGADRNTTIPNFVAAHKSSSSNVISILKSLAGFKFGNHNSAVGIYGNLDTTIMNLNSTDVFSLMVDGQSSVNEWLKFLCLINTPSDYYQAFSHCIDNTILQDWESAEAQGQYDEDQLGVDFETPSSTIIPLGEVQTNFNSFEFDQMTTVLDIERERIRITDHVLAAAIQNTYTNQNTAELTILKQTLSSGTHQQIKDALLSSEYCVLFGLSGSERVSAIDHLVQDDYGWHFILPILRSIPEEEQSTQEVALLNHLKSNNASVLNSFTSQLEEWTDFGEYKDLEISSEIISIYSDFLNNHRSLYSETSIGLVMDFVSDAVPSEIPFTYAVNYPLHDIPIVLGAEIPVHIDLGQIDGVSGVDSDNYKLRIEVSAGHPEFPAQLLPNGRIQITQSMLIREVPAGQVIVNQGSSPETNVLLSINSSYELAPFDMVDIVYGANFGYIGYDQGEIKTVPAMTLLFLQQEVDNELSNRLIRETVDKIEIAIATAALVSAPFTGGSSLLLFAEITAGIAGSVDLIFANQENQMTTQQLQEAQYLQEWKAIKAELDIALIGTGIGAIGATSATSSYALIRSDLSVSRPLRSTRSLIVAKSLRKSVKFTNSADNIQDALVLQKSNALKTSFRTGSLVDDVITSGGQLALNTFIHLPTNTPTTLASNTYGALVSQVTDQTFIPFDNQPYIIQSPATFVDESGANMYDMVVDNELYMKYDLNDGRILLCDVNDGTYHAFVQEVALFSPPSGANVNQVVQEHMLLQLDKLKSMLGMNGTNSVSILGQSYSLSTTNTNTFLGRMADINPIKTEFGDFKNTDLGEVPGGNNLLNRPDNMFGQGYTDWWVNHNLPWIQRAIQRDDEFYFCSQLVDIDKFLYTEYNNSSVATISSLELHELRKVGKQPVNIDNAKWQEICDELDYMETNNYFNLGQ